MGRRNDVAEALVELHWLLSVKADSLELEVVETLEKIVNLLDRTYPEDYGDYRELDFNEDGYDDDSLGR